ncbi:MAG: hypothetical protein GWO08_17260, partial [Gammaproteobacteria bacterium]|nr:hypothetical protein [Gammaproteobacteria bacterium]NIR95332.1 hypothetical protein [Gammaproteobacteria bacterium]
MLKYSTLDSDNDGAGDLLWSKVLDFSDYSDPAVPVYKHDDPVALGIAPGGAVYVAGNSSDRADGSPKINTDMVAAMVDAAGTEIWRGVIDSGNGKDITSGLAVDSGGDLFVAGTNINDNCAAENCTKDIVAYRLAATDNGTG